MLQFTTGIWGLADSLPVVSCRERTKGTRESRAANRVGREPFICLRGEGADFAFVREKGGGGRGGGGGARGRGDEKGREGEGRGWRAEFSLCMTESNTRKIFLFRISVPQLTSG